MRTLLFSTLVLTLSITCLSAQDKDGNPPMEIVKYYFVELITNPDRPELPKAQVDSIQRAHMANIASMANSGKLMLAGPFEGGGGIFILDIDSMEATEEMVAKDPAVSAGRLRTEIRAWYTAKGVFSKENYQPNNKKNEATKN